MIFRCWLKNLGRCTLAATIASQHAAKFVRLAPNERQMIWMREGGKSLVIIDASTGVRLGWHDLYISGSCLIEMDCHEGDIPVVTVDPPEESFAAV